MSKLDEMVIRGQITAVQAQAGRLFAHDAEADGPLRHADMERTRVQAAGFSMVGIGARRYRQAIDHLGPLADIAVLVCVEDRPAREWTDARGENAHAALPMLRLALDQLASFYQLRVAA